MKTKTEMKHTPTSDRPMTEYDIIAAIRRKSLDRDFIVRAVNCHEELRDTLVDLAHYFQDQLIDTGLQDRVRQAIAKAEKLDSDLTCSK